MRVDTVNISAQIPAILSEKLEKVAEIEERSKSYYIKKSLEKFLNSKLEDLSDYFEADEAWQEYKQDESKAVSWKEVKKKYKL